MGISGDHQNLSHLAGVPVNRSSRWVGLRAKSPTYRDFSFINIFKTVECQAIHTTVLLYHVVFFAVLYSSYNINMRNFSTTFQIFKTFEYLSRSNITKCSNFSEIEGKVPLKRSFQLTGNENMVPVSESPTYPGSHLGECFFNEIW